MTSSKSVGQIQTDSYTEALLPFEMKYSVGVCALSLLLFIELPSSLTQKLAFQLVSLPSKSALVLPCLAPPELSEASISWKFTPQSPPGSPAILLRSPLSVQAVGKKDEGTYTCVITGWKGDSPVKLRNSYTVMVFETSGFEFELLGVAEGDVGKDVELPCSPPPASLYSSHSGSSPTAVWYIETQSGRERLYPKEGETNEDGRVRWASPTNLKDDGSVIMSNVTMEDSGVYQYQSKNMLFSPISIFWMLTHLLLGARGTTQETLERAVSIPHSFACLHKEMKSLREEMRDSVEIASKIYHSPEFKLNQIFINQSQLFYDAVPEKLTNDSERNAKMINDWVADKTNNKITDLMDSVSPTTILMLLNTVYFNGKWKVMFDKKMMTSPFVTLSGDMITVPVLYSGKYKLSQRYNTQVKAQVAAFPLSGRTVLYILLPKSSSAEDLEELEKRLNEDNVREMVKELDKVPKEVTEVTLPKIKLSIKTDLMEMLDTLGLTDLPFEPNLCGLSSEERVPALALSEAQHRAFLSLTEQGVEAGAASSISFSRSYSSFSALRPFVLLLWNEQIKSPLFLGRVTEP
ncbi:hypothetical protein COCON_G00105880 [Conger conger]|uniref:Ig-like domain-containing protein n=1 Tax=Conger conger TaxID=82655 RepID=A0A9Q1DIP4_CONCO|nr:hypothetical protein COCON_G00105880 [Conger conger]